MKFLVVIGIVWILAAIAIPAFARYRERWSLLMLVVDVRNAATGQEAYFLNNKKYNSSCMDLPGFEKSPHSELMCTGDATTFKIVGRTARAPGYECTWDSSRNPPLYCEDTQQKS